MSRFQKWISGFLPSTLPLASTVAVDFGSTFTRVRVKDKLVFHEPSCIALHLPTQSVVAIGKAAFQLLGKTPQSIEVIFPVQDGRVMDQDAAEYFLTALWKKIFATGGVWQPFLIHRAVVGIGTHITEIQKEAFRSVLQHSGVHRITLQKKNVAVAQRVLAQKHVPSVFFTIDIGGQTTEMSIFSRGEVVAERALMWGGDHFTKSVLRVMRAHYQVDVGWLTAEKVKREIGHVLPSSSRVRQSVIRGRDVLSNLPKTIHFSGEYLEKPFQELMEELIAEIRHFCGEVPPELLAQTLDTGIFLTGGGGVLPGLSEALVKHMQCPVLMSQSPYEDVVLGL